MAIDPVCGMEVDERTAKDKVTEQGQTYFFCSKDARTNSKRTLRNIPAERWRQALNHLPRWRTYEERRLLFGCYRKSRQTPFSRTCGTCTSGLRRSRYY